MTGAGDLRTRLTLQTPVETPDGQGGVTRGYAALRSVWAKVELVSSRESVAADGDGATLSVRITARAPLALSLQHRLVDDDKTYRITGYRDDRRFVVIDAALRVN